MGTYQITLAEDATAQAEPRSDGLKPLVVRLEDPEHALVYRLGFLGPGDLLDETTPAEQQHRICSWIAEGVVTADQSSQPSRKRSGTVLLPLEADPTKALADAKTLLSVLVTSVRLGVAQGEVTIAGEPQRAPFGWTRSPNVESLVALARAERRQLALQSLELSSPALSKRPRI